MSHENYRAAPEAWSYCFSIFLECGTLPSISTFSEGFFLQPEWSKVGFGIDSFSSGEHKFPLCSGECIPLKGDFPVDYKAVDGNVALAWHSLNGWVLPSSWDREQANQWGKKKKKQHLKMVLSVIFFSSQISACNPELNLLFRDWDLSH